MRFPHYTSQEKNLQVSRGGGGERETILEWAIVFCFEEAFFPQEKLFNQNLSC